MDSTKSRPCASKTLPLQYLETHTKIVCVDKVLWSRVPPLATMIISIIGTTRIFGAESLLWPTWPQTRTSKDLRSRVPPLATMIISIIGTNKDLRSRVPPLTRTYKDLRSRVPPLATMIISISGTTRTFGAESLLWPTRPQRRTSKGLRSRVPPSSRSHHAKGQVPGST